MEYKRLRELKMDLQFRTDLSQDEQELLDELISIFGKEIHLNESLKRKGVCSKCQRPL